MSPYVAPLPPALTPCSYYLPRQSCPSGGIYLFAYSVTVTNEGRNTVLLKNRHWRITDGQQCTREDGCVGFGAGLGGWRSVGQCPALDKMHQDVCVRSIPGWWAAVNCWSG